MFETASYKKTSKTKEIQLEIEIEINVIKCTGASNVFIRAWTRTTHLSKPHRCRQQPQPFGRYSSNRIFWFVLLFIVLETWVGAAVSTSMSEYGTSQYNDS